MLDNDILLAFVFMAILFLRQITIIKHPNKINYAPLMIGIGTISSLVHFIIHPEVTDILLVMRESFFPFLVSVLLYMMMNVLQQTQRSQHIKTQHDFTKELISQITQLKEYASAVEKNMIQIQMEDRASQQEIREKFKEDIKALDTIQTNQANFIKKFDEMDIWHKDVSKAFDNFTEVQLPSLDDVVHKHIDILRIAEQDHFNKVKQTLEKAVESRCEIVDDIEDMKENIKHISNISQTIVKTIVDDTSRKLSESTKPFEQQIQTLKSHSESLSTSLYEGESKLSNIREQSEMIMKQMVLSSKKMSVLESQSSSLHDVYADIKELLKEVEVVKSDYVRSQAQLESIVKEISDSKKDDVNNMKMQMESVITLLTSKVEESLEKLHNHYNIANEDISKSVQFLAKQAQIKKGYSDLDS
ncbi:hypothetical protein N9A28_04775 [Sulfurimonas sp.]|nr:hypothetical protein [Sulfurimonas sp.]